MILVQLELPAGLCDSKETPEASALRELKEETGYHVNHYFYSTAN
jgi:8-oxo-dGTP pyrophosphatase MutT (NUDIX family)